MNELRSKLQQLRDEKERTDRELSTENELLSEKLALQATELDAANSKLFLTHEELESLKLVLDTVHNEKAAMRDLTGQRAELQQQLDEQSRRHADDVTRLNTRLEEIAQAHERERDRVARELAAREGDLAETTDRLAAAQQVRRCSLVTRVPQLTWN